MALQIEFNGDTIYDGVNCSEKLGNLYKKCLT